MAKKPKPKKPKKPAWTPERVQRMAKDPGNRSKIPLAHLKGFAGADKLRAQRALNARLNAPVVPGSQLTGRDLAHEAAAQTSVRYGPEERALQQQITQSEGIGRAIPGWFQAYKDQLTQYRGQAQNAYAGANQQVQALQTQTGQPLTQKAQAGDAAATQAALADPAAQKTAEQAAQIRQMMVGNAGSTIAAQGYNQDIRFGSDLVAADQGRIQAQLKELARYGELQDTGRELAREKGAFNLSARSDIKDREHKSVLERAAFGLDEAKLAQAAASDKADAADKKRSKRDDFIAKYGVSPERWRKMSPDERRRWKSKWEKAGKTPPKGSTTDKYGYDPDQWAKMTVEQRRKAKAQWESAGDGPGGKKPGKPLQEPEKSSGARTAILNRTETIRKYAADRGIKLTPENRNVIVAQMRRTHPGFFSAGTQELGTKAALDLALGSTGKINSATIRKLRQRGIFITTGGDYWKGGNRGAS